MRVLMPGLAVVVLGCGQPQAPEVKMPTATTFTPAPPLPDHYVAAVEQLADLTRADVPAHVALTRVAELAADCGFRPTSWRRTAIEALLTNAERRARRQASGDTILAEVAIASGQGAIAAAAAAAQAELERYGRTPVCNNVRRSPLLGTLDDLAGGPPAHPRT
ncbi:MAG TPA: hypothetical protein VIL69_19930 [Roseomonas sp.]|jgi:hypothetical protein